MFRTTLDKHISKDFLRIFQRQISVFKDEDLFNKSTLFNRLRSPYWQKHVMEPFTYFTSSAMMDHDIFTTFPQRGFAK